ncbi:NAD(P)-dependent oxidoreductase [Psychrobacter sp. AOP22-C1-22]|uniref:NAD(P)-dependent oxidoreductase n=1 Tax=unclassified Psychrobacter TaxID=196806 RepID=UPI0017889E26|nr:MULTISPECIES: NAD(P)-dependent oxidoreductase [unclassified Psychrobacter]MDN5801635.1 D-2-hydroxyacid dehydrogenase [Psychrobacter sp.]MBE0407033.1 D-2-hydroxyacid dehydrogenase [Psychrobacter sp. FME6]MBE0444960.1 D-2-hydroxyacid dehydrogenase [Psychrobacter sp. FME5]MDN5890633.1 D-2-hydroxyacid dehydrogenase [Psychrobacter sp.]MDN5897606.1 D-2-hydroxyacid dehydrogenase [Psychrobacter sp.]
MQAVFLDKGTFSDNVKLPAPTGVTDYITYNDTPQDNDLMIERCKDADIIITNKVQISAEVIAKLPKLKLIQLTATGMNNVDQDACRKHNITLYNVAGYAVKSVPEHTFMLMLAAMRAGIYYHNKAIDGTWADNGNFCLLDIPLIDLEDKTLGIIGIGTIGKRVTDIARAFGMTVLWAEHQGQAPRNDNYTDFDEVLARADVISLHCPLNDATQHLINADTLAKMAKQPLIVNVARGGIVDSQALTDALNNEQIIGYASDVFEQEPVIDDDPLLTIANHPRVIFSPHNAWGSKSAQDTLWQILSKQVTDFIEQN